MLKVELSAGLAEEFCTKSCLLVYQRNFAHSRAVCWFSRGILLKVELSAGIQRNLLIVELSNVILEAVCS